MTQLQLIAHSPGPSWVAGTAFREQPGVELHLATMRGWLESGVLVMGGPFLDEEGGGTAVVRFGSLDQADAAAQADPAVLAGLLLARTRPWLVGLTSVELPALPQVTGPG